jgi:hypothetical protein
MGFCQPNVLSQLLTLILSPGSIDLSASNAILLGAVSWGEVDGMFVVVLAEELYSSNLLLSIRLESVCKFN